VNFDGPINSVLLTQHQNAGVHQVTSTIYPLIAVIMAILPLATQAAVDFSAVTKYAAACDAELGFDASA
jgi:hypothetical protein